MIALKIGRLLGARRTRLRIGSMTLQSAMLRDRGPTIADIDLVDTGPNESAVHTVL